MKKFVFFIQLFFCPYFYLCAHTLQPGDILIIGFNFRDPDQFSFVNTVDLPAGEEIFFTDCGWKSDNSFRSGEGIVKYVVPEGGKSKGSVVTYNLDPGFTTSGVGGFFGLSLDGDQIFVYQGTFTEPVFIFGFHAYNGQWQTETINNNTSTLPSSLQNGYSGVAINKNEGGYFNCSYIPSDVEDLKLAVATPANWLTQNSRVSLPSSCSFNALPYSFLGLDAKFENDRLALNISIKTISNKSYILEKSIDGNTFQTLWNYYGPSLDTIISDYDLEEEAFYRLSAYSESGSLLSKTIYISNKEDLRIFPNPFDKDILISGGKDIQLLELYSGQQILKSYYEHQDYNDLKGVLESSSTGIYYLRTINKDGVIKNYKLVKL